MISIDQLSWIQIAMNLGILTTFEDLVEFVREAVGFLSAQGDDNREHTKQVGAYVVTCDVQRQRLPYLFLSYRIASQQASRRSIAVEFGALESIREVILTKGLFQNFDEFFSVWRYSVALLYLDTDKYEEVLQFRCSRGKDRGVLYKVFIGKPADEDTYRGYFILSLIHI